MPWISKKIAKRVTQGAQTALPKILASLAKVAEALHRPSP